LKTVLALPSSVLPWFYHPAQGFHKYPANLSIQGHPGYPRPSRPRKKREVFRGAIVANENDVSVTLPATVEKVLPERDAEPEKIRISVDGCDELFSEFHVENTIKNESGDSVTLKRGANIEATINADSHAVKKKE
jgi:hypothetical protein